MTLRDKRLWIIVAIAAVLLLLTICGYGCGASEAGDRQTTWVVRHPQGTWEADRRTSLGDDCSCFATNGLGSCACPGYTIREVEVRP